MWRSGDNFRGLNSYYEAWLQEPSPKPACPLHAWLLNMGSVHQTQVLMLAKQALYALSHLTLLKSI